MASYSTGALWRLAAAFPKISRISRLDHPVHSLWTNIYSQPTANAGDSRADTTPRQRSAALIFRKSLWASVSARRYAAALIGAVSTAVLSPGAHAAPEFCPAPGTLVFDSDFSGNWVTRFGKGQYAPAFPGGSYWEQVRVGSDTCLRVHYKNGAAGAANGMFLFMPLTPTDRYRAETKLLLKPGFVYNHGGKLIPGFEGGHLLANTRPDGTNGFLSRPYWNYQGRASAYVYHMDQLANFGDTLPFAPLPSGKLHTIRHELILNTPGRRDGSIRFWLNGVLGLQKTGMRFRTVPWLKIDRASLETFFGGNGPGYGPKRDEYIDFCHVKVCKL